jgi:class 3 adenylate cyclase
MGFRLQRRLALFSALAALAGTAVVSYLAYRASEQALHDGLRAQAISASSILAARAGEELKALADRARFYADTAQRAEFEADGELLALSVHKAAPGPDGEVDGDHWSVTQRWTLPEGAPMRLSETDLARLDERSPVDLARVAQGKSDAIFARRSGVAVLRLALPYGHLQALVIEAKLSRLQALFGHRDDLFAFMTADRGQLVIASDAAHFGPGATGKDLSRLPLLAMAAQARSAQGPADYRETPQGPLQHAAYARVSAGTSPVPGLTVFAQVPAARADAWLARLAWGLGAASLAFALCLGYVIGWAGPRWAWGLAALEAAKSPVEAPQHPDPAPIPAPVAQLAGKRATAAVLSIHLDGLDKLASAAEPEALLKLLNSFFAGVTQAIESRGGVVDHCHGGSFVALWGVSKRPDAGAQAPVPVPVPIPFQDVPHAIEAAQAIREAAAELAQQLELRKWPTTELAMGLHYGPVTVGELGAAGRLNYTAIGEAIETAARIRYFGGQFGTDFVMTGPAAARAGKAIQTEQLTAGDESTPDLYELETEPPGKAA